jgi:hypothetical protein
MTHQIKFDVNDVLGHFLLFFKRNNNEK